MMAEDKKTKRMYYAVFYDKDGSVHMWPNESKERCLEVLYETLKCKRNHDRCARTTVITREVPNDFDYYVFGKPESLNVLKKFDKDIKAGKAKFEWE